MMMMMMAIKIIIVNLSFSHNIVIIVLYIYIFTNIALLPKFEYFTESAIRDQSVKAGSEGRSLSGYRTADHG
jgi:hypothetical protein